MGIDKVSEIKKLLRKVVPLETMIFSFPIIYPLNGYDFQFTKNGQKDTHVFVDARNIEQTEVKYMAYDILSRWVFEAWKI